MIPRLLGAWAALLLLAGAPSGPAGAEPALAEYLRLHQALARLGQGPERAALEAQAAAARERLMEAAARGSRLIVTAEQQRWYDLPGRQELARLVARDGRVTLEALGGPHPRAPDWERAGELPREAYLGLLRRLLEAPAFLGDTPPQALDPNAPPPRRAVAVRLIVGDELRELEALYAEPYARLEGLARVLLDFARTVPLLP